MYIYSWRLSGCQQTKDTYDLVDGFALPAAHGDGIIDSVALVIEGDGARDPLEGDL